MASIYRSLSFEVTLTAISLPGLPSKMKAAIKAPPYWRIPMITNDKICLGTMAASEQRNGR
jgi:hypothetical protein